MTHSLSFLDHRPRWIELAESLKPALHRAAHWPRDLIAIERDEAAWQGWRARVIRPAAALSEMEWAKGEGFALDYAEYLVGYVSFRVEAVGAPVGAPLRLRCRFGERLCELGENPDDYGGWLSRAWIQDDVITLDSLPAEVRLPRRYAFRYMSLGVADHALPYRIRVADVRCESVSAIDLSSVRPLPDGAGETARAMDRAALRTMAACSQTVVEDGPKRDRRMWMGDMRLCALANYATVREFDLIRRCLYLFAGLADDAGLISACVYEQPSPTRGQDEIVDYSVLFAPALLEYAEASGDWSTARELWPVARRQLQIVLEDFTEDGLFINPKGKWVFIDWNPDALDTQAPAQGMIMFAFAAGVRLAERAGDAEAAEWCRGRREWMRGAAMRDCWDDARGLFVSGERRQVSWAAQAWLALGGALPADETRQSFTRLLAHPEAVSPVTPSLYHHCVLVMMGSGMKREASQVMREFWGGMIERGADAFWEVFDPADPHRSPYGAPLGHLVNSYCHAWSATPAALLRGKDFSANDGEMK